jgi:histidyl-tRNA synthetase
MLPKGTRDLLPDSTAKRDFILQRIEKIFRNYAFQKIETPALELNKTLSGKYGEEGDRLMFKILPRGRKLEQLDGKSAKDIQDSIEEALRYDLTVPLARFVVDNQNDLVFPFKRYQIQNVWRADRPQKGRYREFTQCDADIVGPAGRIQEVELILIYNEVFKSLGVSAQIRINHRGVLQSLAESLGVGDNWLPFTIALDKLDKLGWDKVAAEWRELGIDSIPEHIAELFREKLPFSEGLQRLAELSADVASLQQPLEELSEIQELLPDQNIPLVLDMSLARGLDYYTGCIFEVIASNTEMGSIGGGGRYDDLTGLFGGRDLAGVGISFGLERIQLVMEAEGLFPSDLLKKAELLLAPFEGLKNTTHALAIADFLRKRDISCDVYPLASARMKKKIDYALRYGIRYIGLIGDEETAKCEISLKDLETGEQENKNLQDLAELFGTD